MTPAKESRDMKEIYFNSTSRRLTNGKGEVYTTEQAREIVNSGTPYECNLSMQRLISYDFDYDKLDEFYRENP